MAILYFPSLDDAEVVEVELLKLDGTFRSLRLLVDSGFTGTNSLVLSDSEVDLVRATLPPTHTSGALQGPKDRGWVACRIAGLKYQGAQIAIVTDISSLSLPPGVEGLAGLTFLRQFAHWGGERTNSGWQFFLSDGQDSP